MAIEAELADGRILEFPDGTSPSVIQATVKKVLASTQASAKPAGFSLKDIGTAFGQGAVGSAEALTNVAGAGNAASQYLSGVSENLGKQYTPERQAEMQRQQQRMKKAEESGSTLEELKAGVQNIAEAPLQSIAQGVGSFVPYIPAIFGGPVAAALGLGERAVVAANLVVKAYAPVVGTAQGAGSVKGAIYDAVYKAEIADKVPEAEARQKADAAQEYTGQNLDQIALGAGLGYIASKGGIEKYFTKEGREKAGQALLPRVGTAIAEESVTEGAQGGQERLASNLALQRTGRDLPTFQGVAGQAFQEGLIGGLTAGPVSAIGGRGPKPEVTPEAPPKVIPVTTPEQPAYKPAPSLTGTDVATLLEEQAKGTAGADLVSASRDRQAEQDRIQQEQQAQEKKQQVLAQERTRQMPGMVGTDTTGTQLIQLQREKQKLEEAAADKAKEIEYRKILATTYSADPLQNFRQQQAAIDRLDYTTPEVKAQEPAMTEQLLALSREDEKTAPEQKRSQTFMIAPSTEGAPVTEPVVTEAKTPEAVPPVVKDKKPGTPTERQEAIAFGKAIGATQPYPGSLSGRVNLPAQKAAKEGNFQGVLSALEKSKNAIVAEIAKRAKNLVTKIVIDDQAQENYAKENPLMRQMSIDGAKMHLEALNKIRELASRVDVLPDGSRLGYDITGQKINAFDQGKDAGQVSLTNIADNGHSMFSPLPTGPIKLRTKEDFKALQKAFEDITSEVGEDALQMTSTGSAISMGVAGAYDSAADTIRVPEYFAKDEQVLAHEIVHAQVLQKIASPSLREKPIVIRLNKLYQHVQAQLEEKAKQDKNYRKPYALESIQEFVAEGMGNPSFQLELKRIKYENTSAWDSFVQTIANLIGVKRDTAFTELLSVYSELTTEATPVAATKTTPIEEGPMPKSIDQIEAETRADEQVGPIQKYVADLTDKKKKPLNLWNVLRGRLTKSEVSDISPDFKYMALRQPANKGGGTDLSTLVQNGDLDDFLPPAMRMSMQDPNEMVDESEAVEYIKEKLRSGGEDYYTYDTQVALKQAFGSIEEAENAVREFLRIEDANELLAEAAAEQRAIDKEAEVITPEGEDRTAQESVQEGLTAPTPEELKAADERAKSEEKRLAAEKKAADDKAKADKDVGEFTLTGSDRAADADANQGQMFEDQPPPELNTSDLKEVKGRHPQIQAAAKLLQDGKMTREDFEKYVDYYKPIAEVSSEKLLPPTSEQKMNETVNADKRDKINVPVEDGTKVGLRMDLPARERGGSVVSIHEGKSGKLTVGKLIGFRSTGWLKDVTFEVRSQDKGLAVAAGASKAPQQTVEGTWFNLNPEETYAKVKELMKDPAWSQIGFDPSRHGYFYDRKTRQPVTSASEMYQVGQFLLAKNVKYAPKEQFLYSLRGKSSGQITAFEQSLRTLLNKFGLKDIGLKLSEGMRDEGSYAAKLIQIAADSANPIRTLRHESVHALRELGFFTDAQWKSLSKMAKDKWIDQYLKQRNIDGKPLKAGEESRYDAYMREYKGDMEKITEEAVADAFADFDTKPPAGMIQAIIQRLRNLFQSIRSALTKMESAEQIFGKVEKGALKPEAERATTESKSLRDRATANFKRWFGDSMAVDKSGEPLVLYHGTPTGGFTVFDKSKQGTKGGISRGGFSFTTDYKAAKSYAEGFSEETNNIDTLVSEANKIFAEDVVYTDDVMDKFYDVDKDSPMEWSWQAIDSEAQLREDIEEVAQNFFDFGQLSVARKLRELNSKSMEKMPDVMSVYLQVPKGSPVFKATRETLGNVLKTLDVRNLPTKAAIVELDDGNKIFYVAEPTQIKSATGNNGDYSLTDADIRKSLRTTAGVKEKAQELLQRRKPINKEALSDVDPDYVTRLGKVFNPESKTIIDKIEGLKDGFWRRTAQGLADQYRTIKDYDMRSYMLARMSKTQDGGLEGLMFNGHIFNDGGALNIKKNTKGLMESLKPVGLETDRYMMWIALNRESNLPEGKRSPGISELVKDKDQLSQGTLNGKSRLEVYQSVQKDMNALNKSVLDLALNMGVINSSKREIAELESRDGMDEKRRAERIAYLQEHPGAYERFSSDLFYIPFYKEMEDGDVQSAVSSAGLTNQKFSAELKGMSDKPFADLMENTLRNWSHILSASMKNQAALSTVEATMDAGATIPNMKPGLAYQDGQVVSSTTGEIAGDGKLRPEYTEPGKGMVKVMKDGQPMYFEVLDPMLLDSITSIGYMGPKSKFLDVARDFKNLLQYGVTISPIFKTNNLIRDSISSMAVSDLKKNPFANVIEGWNLSAKNNPVHIEALAGGAIFNFGSTYEGDQAKLVKRLLKQGVKAEHILDTKGKIEAGLKGLWDKYHELGNKSEAANRMALYKQLRDKGMSHLEASFQARDLMDFSMQGSWPAFRTVTQVVPFINARVQGLYKLGRDGVMPTSRVLYNTITGKEINYTDKQKAYSFSLVTASVSLASMALYMAFKDDEDYKKRDEWDRDNFWWIKLPGMDYALRVPKPFEIGAFGTMSERILEQIIDQGAEGKTFGNSLSRMLFDTFAMNPMPQMFKPLLDLYANKDSFTGAPIESAGMERLSKQERMTDQTSPLAKALGGMSQILGEKGELSPAQVDYAIKGYFGWLGSMAATTSMYATMPFKEGAYPDTNWMDKASLGLVRTLPSNQSKYTTAFYDANKEISQAFSDMRHYADIGDSEKVQQLLEEKGDKIRLFKLYDKTAKSMANVRKQIRIIMNDNSLDGATKQEEINRMKEIISMYAEQAESIRKSLK